MIMVETPLFLAIKMAGVFQHVWSEINIDFSVVGVKVF
jgi:hypothetical protein